jgi:alkyl hydroperoxide reductase subunit AhpC
LADYQEHIEEFRQENVDIITLSVDPLDKAKEMAERVRATFPIGYGLKVPEDADKVGAYWEDRRKIIHATNFIIDSDKKLTQACYATGPIGRIVAEDALRSIQGAKKRKAQ